MQNLPRIFIWSLTFTLASVGVQAASPELKPAIGNEPSGKITTISPTPKPPMESTETAGDPTRNVGGADKQIAQWEEKTREKPENAESWVNLAEAFLQKARETNDPAYYTRCETALDKGQGLQTENYHAMRLRSILHSTRHQFPKAIEWTEKAIQISPNDPLNYGNLGDIYAELGDYEKAADNYEKMVQLKPGRASYSRASYMQELYGDERAARAYMQMAVNAGAPTGEDTAWCMVYLGNLDYNAGFLPAAEKAYHAALIAFPNFFHAYAGLGRVKAAQKNYPAAIEMYEKALQAGPHHEVYGQLIELYTLTGQKEKTKEIRKRLGDLNAKYHQNQMDIDFEVAEIDAEHGQDLANAFKLAKEEVKTHGNVKAYDGLAWIAYLNSDMETALEASEQAMSLGYQSSLIYYHAAKIHEKLGHKQESIYLLNKALSRCPYFHVRYAADARMSVERLTKALSDESIAAAKASGAIASEKSASTNATASTKQ